MGNENKEVNVKIENNAVNAITENKMGVMPVNKLLLTMSIPMMTSMFIQGLYNIIDSIFVARICEDALTAVSLAFPLQTLIIAVAVGTGIGVNAVLSKSLGEGDMEQVNAVATNGILLAVINYLIFLTVGLTVVKAFYSTQTTDKIIVEYGVQYLTIVCVGSGAVFLQLTFERLLQATGNTFYAMISQISGAIVNLILDPLLIFGLGAFPKLGVAGAAIATISGQIVAATIAFIFNITRNKEVTFQFRGFRPSWKAIKPIYVVGIPAILMQSLGSILTYGMNRILIGFTSTATAVFGVYFKIQNFVFMPVYGLTHGLVPIVAYNYGAQKRKRLLKTIQLCLIYAIAIMTTGMILFLSIPEQIFRLFDASDFMMEMGVPALRIISLHFPLAAVGIILGMVFQALGNSMYSLIVSLCRQLVILLPLAYLLSLSGNIDYVWFSFPIAEFISFLLNIFFFIKINQKIISKIREE